MDDERIRHLLTRAIGILQRSSVDFFDSDAADVVVTESLEALKSYKHSYDSKPLGMLQSNNWGVLSCPDDEPSKNLGDEK